MATGPAQVGWEDVLGGGPWADGLPQVDIQPDDDATILYTSGTTAWGDLYRAMAESYPELVGGVLAWAEAHVVRLALVYGLGSDALVPAPEGSRRSNRTGLSALVGLQHPRYWSMYVR